MSVATNSDDSRVAPINKEKPGSDARYTLKVTKENKTEGATVSLNSRHRQIMMDRVVNNSRWRSDAQFMVDAIVHYLDDESASLESPSEIVDGTEWRSDNQFCFNMTETLFEEVEMMVNHTHTPWNTKQDFYICAIRSFVVADYPVVNQR